MVGDIKADYTKKMTTIRFVEVVKPKSCSFLFWNCNQLTEIKNMENLYTNECTAMNSMFSSCNNLTNLDLRNFDTSNVTNMKEMFK